MLEEMKRVLFKLETLTLFKKIGLSILVFIAPIKPLLLTVLGLIFVDLFTGVWASVKRGNPITSSGLKKTIVKFFMYELTIILGFVVEKYLIGDLLPLVKIFSTFIGLTELASLVENIATISPELLPLVNKFKITEQQALGTQVQKAETNIKKAILPREEK